MVLVMVPVVLVAWAVAGRIVRVLARADRADGTALAVGLPPVPAPPVAAPPAPVDVSRLEPKVVLIPPVAVPRPVRRCGNCRAAGHVRPSCPRLTGALPLPQL